MFQHLADLVQQQAGGLDGYKRAAETAFNAARNDERGAAGYLILGILAQRIYESSHGLPMTAADCEKDFRLFDRHVRSLNKAASVDASEQIRILEAVSRSIAQDMACEDA